MKKSHVWIILFWSAIIGLKIWSGFHGQTSPADRAAEIAGFAFMLTGSLFCIFFTRLNQYRFKNLGSEAATKQIFNKNYFAIFIQGILLIISGALMIFLKWWIAVVIGCFFGAGILALCFYGWPHLEIKPRDAGFVDAEGRRRTELFK